MLPHFRSGRCARTRYDRRLAGHEQATAGHRQNRRHASPGAAGTAPTVLLHFKKKSVVMYFVTESANIEGGLRERKRAATRAAITAVARSRPRSAA